MLTLRSDNKLFRYIKSLLPYCKLALAQYNRNETEERLTWNSIPLKNSRTEQQLARLQNESKDVKTAKKNF